MDDDQYFEMLRDNQPSTKKQKSTIHDWEKDPKYHGKSRLSAEEDESIDSDNIPEFEEMEEVKKPHVKKEPKK